MPDTGPILAAIESARKAQSLEPLLQLCGLFSALLHTTTRAINERLGAVRPLEPVDEDLTVAEFAARSKMSKTWVYRHAAELPYAHRLGRSWRFSWAGYVKARKTM